MSRRRLALPGAIGEAPPKTTLDDGRDVAREAVFQAADQLEIAKRETRKIMDNMRAMFKGRGL